MRKLRVRVPGAGRDHWVPPWLGQQRQCRLMGTCGGQARLRQFVRLAAADNALRAHMGRLPAMRGRGQTAVQAAKELSDGFARVLGVCNQMRSVRDTLSHVPPGTVFHAQACWRLSATWCACLAASSLTR
jgi:hypothetical protein